MKKFTIKIFTLFIIIQFIASTLLTVFDDYFFNKLYQISKYQNQVCKNVTNEKVKTLFVGNSQIINALIPEDYPDSRVLALPGGSIAEMYFMIDCYFQKNKKPELIVLAPSITDVFWPVTFWRLNAHYNYYNYDQTIRLANDLREQNSFNEISGRLLQFEERTNYSKFLLSLLLKRIRFLPSYIANLQSFRMDVKEELRIASDLQKTKGFSFFSEYDNFSPTIRRGLLEIIRRDSTLYSSFQISYFEKISNLLKSQMIPVKLIFMPIPTHEIAKIPSNKITFLKEDVKNIFHQINFELIESGPYSKMFFLDAIHLNKEGQNRFSKDLKSKL